MSERAASAEWSRSLRAFNTATESENRIHDDAVARRFGFSGGLVPGVDVYAYMCAGPVRRWGEEWLRRGVAEVRFPAPTYDGEQVVVSMGDDGRVGVTNAAGRCTASGTVGLAPEGTGAIDPGVWRAAPAPQERPPAAPEVLVPGTELGAVDLVFDADDGYLDDIREVLDVYRLERIAHPGWISRFGNWVLAANVRLGPWMHVGHTIRHLGIVHHGQTVSARGRVAAEYEHKGHRFSELDLVVSADESPVATIHHVAIYRPRQVAEH